MISTLQPDQIDLIAVAGIALTVDKLQTSNERFDLYMDDSGETVYSITAMKAGQSTNDQKQDYWTTCYFEKGGLSLFLDGQEKRINGRCRVDIAPHVQYRINNNTDQAIGFLSNWKKKDQVYDQ